MKKVNSLLKRAGLFEKMAVYGNREEFLRSLAEFPYDDLPPQKDLAKANQAFTQAQVSVDSALSSMQEGARLINTGSLPSNAYSQASGWTNRAENVPDLKAHINVLFQAAKDLYQAAMSQGNEDAAWKFSQMGPSLNEARRQISIFEQNIIPIPSSTPQPTPVDYVSNTPAPTAPARPQYPRINVSDQKNVEQYTVSKGLVSPTGLLEDDGILGPKTRKSIEIAKKHLGMERSSDQDLFRKLRELKAEESKPVAEESEEERKAKFKELGIDLDAPVDPKVKADLIKELKLDPSKY